MNELLKSDDDYENRLQEKYDAARARAIECENYTRSHPRVFHGIEEILIYGDHNPDQAHRRAFDALFELRAYRASKTI